MGEDMFIMYHIGWHELALEVDLDVLSAYNKMHSKHQDLILFFIFILKLGSRLQDVIHYLELPIRVQELGFQI